MHSQIQRYLKYKYEAIKWGVIPPKTSLALKLIGMPKAKFLTHPEGSRCLYFKDTNGNFVQYATWGYWFWLCLNHVPFKLTFDSN